MVILLSVQMMMNMILWTPDVDREWMVEICERSSVVSKSEPSIKSYCIRQSELKIKKDFTSINFALNFQPVLSVSTLCTDTWWKQSTQQSRWSIAPVLVVGGGELDSLW